MSGWCFTSSLYTVTVTSFPSASVVATGSRVFFRTSWIASFNPSNVSADTGAVSPNFMGGEVLLNVRCSAMIARGFGGPRVWLRGFLGIQYFIGNSYANSLPNKERVDDGIPKQH